MAQAVRVRHRLPRHRAAAGLAPPVAVRVDAEPAARTRKTLTRYRERSIDPHTVHIGHTAKGIATEQRRVRRAVRLDRTAGGRGAVARSAELGQQLVAVPHGALRVALRTGRGAARGRTPAPHEHAPRPRAIRATTSEAAIRRVSL